MNMNMNMKMTMKMKMKMARTSWMVALCVALAPAAALADKDGRSGNKVDRGQENDSQAGPGPEPREDRADQAGEALPEGARDLDPEVYAAIQELGDEGLQALAQKIDGGYQPSERETAILAGAMHLITAKLEAGLSYRRGDIVIGDGLAVLHLGQEFRYLDPADTTKVLVDGWGNPPGQNTLGMILPATISPFDTKQGWGVVIAYTEDGYVDDDDAEDIDYDELLEAMQEATEKANPQRVALGYEEVALLGWAEPPHYDRGRRSLYWAKELAFDDATSHTLNYSIRVLGRRGVLELEAVASMEQMAGIKPAMESIYGLVEFQPGHRYADFDPSIDKVAAYGVGALIAGKVAAKVGLWALILKILIGAKKLVVVLFLGLGVAIRKLFGVRTERSGSDVEPESGDLERDDNP